MRDRKKTLDFIPSQTVREYARKTKHLFSDMDIATILYHALSCGGKGQGESVLRVQIPACRGRRNDCT